MVQYPIDLSLDIPINVDDFCDYIDLVRDLSYTIQGQYNSIIRCIPNFLELEKHFQGSWIASYNWSFKDDFGKKSIDVLKVPETKHSSHWTSNIKATFYFSNPDDLMLVKLAL